MNIRQHTSSMPLKTGLGRIALAVAMALTAQPGVAAVSISSSPLLTAVGVAPNVFFVLDDSGSMQWERMPGDIMPNNSTNDGYLFPLPKENWTSQATYCAGGSPCGNYGDNMPDFNDTTPDNVRFRSSQVNAMFYNPNVDYEPWMTHAGGSSLAKVPYFAGLGDGKIDPKAAPYNPARTIVGTLDLTIEQSLNARWYGNDKCSSAGNTKACKFYPVTFFQYVGNKTARKDILVAPLSDFRKYQIRGSGLSATGYVDNKALVGDFVWSSGKTRTVAEELQNFANWFSYYRSRMLAAKGGASLAFSELGEKFRVGYTTINNPGSSTNLLETPITGGFTGSARKAWFDKLLATDVPQQATPLRSALIWAGDYFSAKKSINKKTYDPWLPSGEAACRQSFTILTTDGYWSAENNLSILPSKDNEDGFAWPNNLGGLAAGYKAEAPYSDNLSITTLADIANFYWKTDLSAEPNQVGSKSDPAYWQHMNTFTLSFGVEGTLDQSIDLTTCKAKGNCPVWPNPAPSTADAEKVDDLWHAAVNGHGKFVGAQDPEQFKKGLTDALQAINEQAASAASLSGNSTSITAGSTVFQGKYVGAKWTGDLVAWSLGLDGAVQATPKWEASAKLPAHGDRKIYALVGGVVTEFINNKLGQATIDLVGGADVVNYIRGDQSKETASGFRKRDGLIGDIVNSSPAYVGAPPNRGYDRTTVAGHGSYANYRSTKASRADSPLVFVGANDGMLHAFDANTGAEVFAYIPSKLLSRLSKLTKQDYAHEFFVDGSVIAEDVYDGSNWRTILIVSLGRGDKSMFALDLSDTWGVNATSKKGELTGSPPKVLWELSGGELGNVVGVPMVAPMNNGTWAVVVGNGYNGQSDKGFLYVINAMTGAVIKAIPTDAKTENGLGGAGGWDDDGDGDVDLLYAGDLKGQMWKFDVSKPSSADWATATTAPMFVAKDPVDTTNTKVQPITAPPIVGAHPDTGERWVFFGTGKFLSDADRSDTSIQTWYGLRDVNPVINGRGELAKRIITDQGDRIDKGVLKGTYRLVSDVNDSSGGDPVVSSSGTYLKQGWYIDLVLKGAALGTPTGERMLARNTLLKDVLLGETLTPNNTSCGDLGDGWLMAVNPWFGGRPKDDFFDTNVDLTVNTDDHVDGKTVSGWKLGNGGVPYMQQCEDGYCMTTTSTDGDKAPETTHANSGLARGRLSWREILRN